MNEFQRLEAMVHCLFISSLPDRCQGQPVMHLGIVGIEMRGAAKELLSLWPTFERHVQAANRCRQVFAAGDSKLQIRENLSAFLLSAA